MVGHVAPEAAVGGPIALIEEGDVVVVDVENRRLDIEIEQTELLRRQSIWSPKTIDYPSGALSKYAKLVSSASDGAVTL